MLGLILEFHASIACLTLFAPDFDATIGGCSLSNSIFLAIKPAIELSVFIFPFLNCFGNKRINNGFFRSAFVVISRNSFSKLSGCSCIVKAITLDLTAQWIVFGL